MPKKTTFLLTGGALVLLVVGMAIGLRLVKQPQQIPTPRASVGGGTATLSFSGPATVNSGATLPIAVNLAVPTTPNDNGIVGVKAVITTNSPYVTITDNDVAGSLPTPWLYQIQTASTGSTTTITINAAFVQASATGYTAATPGPVTFATLNFATSGSGPVQLDWNTSLSEVWTKDNHLDVLSNQLTSGSFTVASGGGSSPTPTLTPASPTPTPTGGTGGDGGPTPTPTAGPTNACGGTCGSNVNCNAGLTCAYGYCRNPSCTLSTNCTCSSPTPTPTAIAYATATPRTTPRTTPTTYPTPTGSSSNPFLGGQASYPTPVVSVPPLYTPQPTPAPKMGLFSRFIAFIVNLLQALFLRK